VPLTKVGDTSSGNTTFTVTTVVDGSAWDLSAIEEGDVAVTSDGYSGEITAIDDGNDTLTIEKGWISPRTEQGRRGGSIKPTDTSTVTIHRVAQCRSILIKMLRANTDIVRVGLNGAAVVTDFPVEGGANVTIFPAQRRKHVRVTEIYVRADSGTQTVAWMVLAK
jgi:hypothetical protein